MELRNGWRAALPLIVVAAVPAGATPGVLAARPQPVLAARDAADKAHSPWGQGGQGRWSGAPPPGQRPGGPPPGMEQWRAWRAAHRNVLALQGTVRGLSALENDPTLRLSGKQARSVLPTLKEWRSKKTISDTEAKQVREKIAAALNPAQKAKLVASGHDFHGMGRPPRGGDGPPPGGPGGSRFGGPDGPPPGEMEGPPDGMGGPPPQGGMGGPPDGGMDAHSRGSGGDRGRRGGPGGQFGGPMGHGGPPSFPKPRDYNPLNPETSPFTFDVARNKAALDKLMRQLSAAR